MKNFVVGILTVLSAASASNASTNCAVTYGNAARPSVVQFDFELGEIVATTLNYCIGQAASVYQVDHNGAYFEFVEFSVEPGNGFSGHGFKYSGTVFSMSTDVDERVDVNGRPQVDAYKVENFQIIKF